MSGLLKGYSQQRGFTAEILMFKDVQKLGSLSKNGLTANQHGSNQLANNPPRSGVLHCEPRTNLDPSVRLVMKQSMTWAPTFCIQRELQKSVINVANISHVCCLKSTALLLFASSSSVLQCFAHLIVHETACQLLLKEAITVFFLVGASGRGNFVQVAVKGLAGRASGSNLARFANGLDKRSQNMVVYEQPT